MVKRKHAQNSLQQYLQIQKNKSKKARPDALHLYLAINKITHKIKEHFPRSTNRSFVLYHLYACKESLYNQCSKEPLLKTPLETQAWDHTQIQLEKCIDNFESDLDTLNLDKLDELKKEKLKIGKEKLEIEQLDKLELDDDSAFSQWMIDLDKQLLESTEEFNSKHMDSSNLIDPPESSTHNID